MISLLKTLRELITEDDETKNHQSDQPANGVEINGIQTHTSTSDSIRTQENPSKQLDDNLAFDDSGYMSPQQKGDPFYMVSNNSHTPLRSPNPLIDSQKVNYQEFERSSLKSPLNASRNSFTPLKKPLQRHITFSNLLNPEPKISSSSKLNMDNRNNKTYLQSTPKLTRSQSACDIRSFEPELKKNKNGVEITGTLDFGVLDLNRNKYLTLWLENKGLVAQNLLEVKLDTDGQENSQFELKRPKPGGLNGQFPIVVKTNCRFYLTCVCNATTAGKHDDFILFTFDGFEIGRSITAIIKEEKSLAELVANDQNSYRKGGRNTRGLINSDRNLRQRLYESNDAWIVPGERPGKSINKHLRFRSKPYNIPQDLFKALETRTPMTEVFPELRESLHFDNYAAKFHALLYCEEVDERLQMREYDMDDTILVAEREFLVLTVPGLSEGRPSLISSDKVILNSALDPRTFYEGYVHAVRQEDVCLKFNQIFHSHYNGEKYNVTFHCSRSSYKRHHHALDTAKFIEESVLFPKSILASKTLIESRPLEKIEWFNTKLNERQKLAVFNIMRGEIRPIPYLVFGPPGTGKTMTAVEAILQIYTNFRRSRILACASSNSACDILALKLLETNKVIHGDMVRFIAHSREMKSSPGLEKIITLGTAENEREWLYHRIIITTCNQAGVITRYQKSDSHFTHCFIDEASQATEPEALVPMSLVAIGGGVTVLIGDPWQLGPVCRSNIAKDNGLAKSLLERLFENELYFPDEHKFSDLSGFDPMYITKLNINYRSDPRIMHISIKQFYKGELFCVRKADDDLIGKIGAKFPVRFHGVKGEEARDKDSPSWYNSTEAIQCVQYVGAFYDAGVSVNDIGIITPYRKQVDKLTLLMKLNKYEVPKIATIEEFQGGEKKVIILTMVRSSPEGLNFDNKFNLGFVFNEKRFNVAVSRAMSILIVIGDPVVFVKDKIWRLFLDYCLENASYLGCNIEDLKKKLLLRRSLV